MKKVLLAATMMALPLAATAQPVNGFYIGAGAGVNFLMESDIELSRQFGTTTASRSGTSEFNLGFVGVLSVGYGFGNGVRLEVEGNYRQNDVDSVKVTALGSNPRADGTAISYGVMANVLYDFDLGPGSFLTPYIGLGGGYVVTDYDGVRGRGSNGNNVTLDGTDGQFAYQAIVGAAFPIASVPGLAITAEYRFMGTLRPSIDAVGTTTGVHGPDHLSIRAIRGTADVDNYNHSLMIGLRYAFGVTPPPPPPIVAPATTPAPARTFLVFFDFARADLTDRARQIIGEAASSAQRGGVTRIEVSGHTDTVGSARFNQALSERRAAAVAAELERRGVPRSAMVLQGFGFSRLLVPTAANVREPQNRRVEIILR